MSGNTENANDDLEDFFDEIEEVEAEVVAEKGEGGGDGGGGGDDDADADADAENDGGRISGDDHQDDGDVSNGNQNDEPPKKKVKTSSAPVRPIRPRGVVVAAAASSSVTSGAAAATSSGAADVNASKPSNIASVPPPPPPPPPPSSSSRYAAGASLPPPPPPLHPPSHQSVPIGPALGPIGPVPVDVSTAGQGMGLDGQQHQQQEVHSQSNSKKKPVVRAAAGKVWVDPTLSEWPENDFRIFVGNLSGDVSEQQFLDFFQSKYASVARAKIVCDAKGMSKGYGFVSFLQPLDCAKAIREQDQKWLGSRPIRVKRSDWKDRNFSHVQKQQKKEKKRQRR